MGRVRADVRYVTHKVFGGIMLFRQFLNIVKKNTRDVLIILPHVGIHSCGNYVKTRGKKIIYPLRYLDA